MFFIIFAANGGITQQKKKDGVHFKYKYIKYYISLKIKKNNVLPFSQYEKDFPLI